MYNIVIQYCFFHSTNIYWLTGRKVIPTQDIIPAFKKLQRQIKQMKNQIVLMKAQR